MSDNEQNDYFREDTVRFIPERLNRIPIVIRGLTNDEMFVVGGMGIGLGMVIGLVVLAMFGDMAIMATTVFVVAALFFYLGSAALQRLKRGKPETWFYRKLQWTLARWQIHFGSGRPVLRYKGRWAAKHQRRIEEIP